MSQRISGYKRQNWDLYETPEWVTKLLITHLPKLQLVWEPASGGGKIAQVFEDAGYALFKSDINPITEHTNQMDFLSIEKTSADAIVTNPPYSIAAAFIEHALELMKPKKGIVAMLLRTDFDHAKTRKHLFTSSAFWKKIVLTKRIVWFEAPNAAPSFNHAWFIWNWQNNHLPTLAYE